MKYYTLTVAIAISILACKHGQETMSKELSAIEIMQNAHNTAGGASWQQPETLTLTGHANFYTNEDTLHNEVHNMWRVFESKKNDAHLASGKVKIESIRDGKHVILLSYDGHNTYDLNGKKEKSEADQMWSSNFGYGVIRHVFDEGYQLTIENEDIVNGVNTHTIKVTDPKQGTTFFDITQDDFKIVKVAFDTPRGWHHRLYSNFFKKEEYSWLQAGKVELFYNNKIANEVIWTDFDINKNLTDSMFVLSYDL